MPEGQGVGRRRKRAKPTSGATRHLLPEEGGRWVGRKRKSVKPTSGATRHLLPEEGGRMPPFLHRHFERKREIFFVRGQAKVVREAGNGKHRMLHVTGDHGASCRWIYEGKQQTANEKDPSAALGMTKRGNASRPFLFNPEQKPISAPSGHLLPEEGGRSGMSSPSTPFPWKGDARRAGGWPKENESEANLHRCATSFQRKEGVSTRAPSLGRGCRAQRGGVGFFFWRRSRLLFAFPLVKRDRAAVDRVLSYIA